MVSPITTAYDEGLLPSLCVANFKNYQQCVSHIEAAWDLAYSIGSYVFSSGSDPKSQLFDGHNESGATIYARENLLNNVLHAIRTCVLHGGVACRTPTCACCSVHQNR